MFRSLFLILATVAFLFAVLASVILVGTLRLRSQWTSDKAEWTAAATAPASQPATAPAVAGAVPAAGPVKPMTLDEEADPSPATLYLPALQAKLTGHAKLQDHRGDVDVQAMREKEKAEQRAGREKADREKHTDKARVKLDTKLAAEAKLAAQKAEDRRVRAQSRVWIAEWKGQDDSAEWEVEAAAGKYEVDLIYSCPPKTGGDFTIVIADQVLTARTQASRGGDDFRMVTVGNLQLAAGKSTLTIRPTAKSKTSLMNLKAVKLIPAT